MAYGQSNFYQIRYIHWIRSKRLNINQPNCETCEKRGFYVLRYCLSRYYQTLKIQIGRFLLNLMTQHILKQF